jgi:hypothetical protein
MLRGDIEQAGAIAHLRISVHRERQDHFIVNA